MKRDTSPAVATLYFHPWEFDLEQARLPLGRIGRFRTYVGLGRTRARLASLLEKYPFVRAIDVAKRLDGLRAELPSFDVALSGPGREAARETGPAVSVA
jgi:hypothetical protein